MFPTKHYIQAQPVTHHLEEFVMLLPAIISKAMTKK